MINKGTKKKIEDREGQGEGRMEERKSRIAKRKKVYEIQEETKRENRDNKKKPTKTPEKNRTEKNNKIQQNTKRTHTQKNRSINK